MLPDPERTTQASRIYALLLKCYPASFQRSYGERLVLQFKDEHHDALVAGKRLSMLRFWLFIGLDFLHSLLKEVQEEVVRMVKKNFFVYCAIIAGFAVLLLIPIEYQGVQLDEKLDMWVQLFFDPLLIGCGALAFFGIAKVSKSHLLFRIPPLILLVFAVSMIPIPVQNPPYGWVGRPAFTYLYANEDRFSGNLIAAYLLLSMVISIAVFAKKKWLPGVCLLAIFLPLSIPNIAYSISEDSPIVAHTWGENWYLFSLVSVYMIAWFGIAWWLHQEGGKTPVQGALEAA
ncbi:MAG: hypothetical protein V2J07_01965 [Anaerolineae bacterium]|jgi:hypothetical protein|nr:hypothetical protein [Anaerolineae bacterium]